jgi:hypothetical protein
VNGKGSSNSTLPGTIFCDNNIQVPSGQWQQLSMDVYDRMLFLFTAKNLTSSYMVNTDLPGGDASITTVTYSGIGAERVHPCTSSPLGQPLAPPPHTHTFLPSDSEHQLADASSPRALGVV